MNSFHNLANYFFFLTVLIMKVTMNKNEMQMPDLWRLNMHPKINVSSNSHLSYSLHKVDLFVFKAVHPQGGGTKLSIH